MLKEKFKPHFKEWEEDIKKNRNWIILAVLFLIFAGTLNNYFGSYTNQAGSVVVPDLILDHITTFDLSPIYIWLFVIVIAVIIFYPLFFKPSKISYSLGMLSLFILIRAIFTSLTHLKTPDDVIVANFPTPFQNFQFQNDLFFSGHTGLPFLGFLIFKDNKKIKYFMLACSIILGATVLIMHAHYSIDVFAAFFITYGIYVLGNKVQKFINNLEVKYSSKRLVVQSKRD